MQKSSHEDYFSEESVELDAMDDGISWTNPSPLFPPAAMPSNAIGERDSSGSEWAALVAREPDLGTMKQAVVDEVMRQLRGPRNTMDDAPAGLVVPPPRIPENAKLVKFIKRPEALDHEPAYRKLLDEVAGVPADMPFWAGWNAFAPRVVAMFQVSADEQACALWELYFALGQRIGGNA